MRESRNREEMNKLEELKDNLEEGIDVDNGSKEIYEANAKNIDMRNLKATDMKNNKRVILPELDEDDDEIKRNHTKNDLKEVFLRYRSQNCDKFGNILKNNLSKHQIEALRNLKSKISDENLVCTKTDKTGKLSLDTVENYSNKMMKHIENDKVLEPKDVKKIENILNKHADYWIKMTQSGGNTNQNKRIKGNIKTRDNQIPILSGTVKDHKKVKDPKVGPDVRPIMGAMVGPNVGLANFASMIVRQIADDADVENVSKSTEETIAKIEEFNKARAEHNPKNEKVIIGSMDLEKWYPSMIAEPSAKEVRTMFEESEIEWEGMDYDAVCKNLGEFLTKKEIEEEGFEEIVFMKKEKSKKKKS